MWYRERTRGRARPEASPTRQAAKVTHQDANCWVRRFRALGSAPARGTHGNGRLKVQKGASRGVAQSRRG